LIEKRDSPCDGVDQQDETEQAMKAKSEHRNEATRARFVKCGLASLLLMINAWAVQAQSYSLDWSTIAGGGGTSTGGVYAVSGTIGQPVAGKMSGGNFTVDGGFWGLVAAVPTPGAPLLSITLNPQLSTIIVSWPSPSTGWLLQQNTNSVASVNWSNVTSGIQDNGTDKFIFVSPPAGNRFYRLHRL